MFGSGGLIDGFVSDRLSPLIDREGPVWRWVRDDPLTAALDPTSPQSFAKALEVRDLLLSGLPLKIQLTGKSADVAEVQFSSGGTTYRFKETGGTPRNIVWAGAGTLPEASVSFFAPEESEGDAQAKAPALKETGTIEGSGPWALFRLMDAGKMSNDGERRITVTFDRNGQSARFAILLPGESNPFSRGGLWSFRCPTAL